VAKYGGLDLSGRRLSLSRLPTTMLPETLRTIQGNRASVLDAAVDLTRDEQYSGPPVRGIGRSRAKP
jgi:hypothetical protein